MPNPAVAAPADRTLADQAYRRVRADILVGRLQHDYGLGISPVREALMRLEAEGLVVGEAQRGWTVASVSLEGLHDLTRTRQRIEELLVRDAIARGDADWEAGVVAAFHVLSRTALPTDPGDVAGAALWESRHRAFHDAIFAGAGSAWLGRFDAMLVDHSLRYRQIRMFADERSGQPRDVLTEHREIMDAVVARDADRASALLALHVQRTADIVTDSWSGAG